MKVKIIPASLTALAFPERQQCSLGKGFPPVFEGPAGWTFPFQGWLIKAACSSNVLIKKSPATRSQHELATHEIRFENGIKPLLSPNGNITSLGLASKFQAKKHLSLKPRHTSKVTLEVIFSSLVLQQSQNNLRWK